MPKHPAGPVLVTGARGGFASAIIPDLQSDFSLRLTDLPGHAIEGGEYRPADLMNFSEVCAAMEGVDTVVHLAVAPAKQFQTREDAGDKLDPYAEAMMQVNLPGVYHVFEAARRAGVRRIINIGSLTVYFGDRKRPHFEQATPLEPQNLYSCTKLFGENLARVYWREHGMSVLTLRIGQPYPCGIEYYDQLWKTSRRARSSYIAMEDIVRAVRCGLTTETDYGFFNMVSASDNQRFDLTPALALGYRPAAMFCDDGFSLHPEGLTPQLAAKPVTND